MKPPSVDVNSQDAPPPVPIRGLRRLVYLAGAAICFALSVVGVMMPGIPTVPFLLLTSFLLLRSSPALNEKLLRSRTFGPLLRDWQRHRGVRRHVKIVSFTMVAATLAVSLSLVSTSPAAMIGIGLMALVGLIVVWRIPTISD
jgi:uncharacterized membrane protein YbaN (DUF454 family)